MGQYYTTGGFVGTVDFDPGAGIFNLTAPTSLNNYPTNIFISKLDHAGNFVWAKAMGGIRSQMGLSIAIDNAGSGAVYTTGYFQGTVDFDPGVGVFNLTGPYAPQFFVSNIFISKLDSAGNFEWAKRLGESAGKKGNSIATDTFGNVYTTGNFSGVGDFDPGAGTFNLTSAGSDDIFISKLDNTGNFVWAKAMGGTGADVGRSIAIDPAGTGALYTAGSFSGTADFDPGVGTFNFTSAGNVDIFISKLDNSGNFVWAKAAGGSTIDYGQSVALDASGTAYVAGYFRSPSILFDSMTFANADNTGSTSDIFIAKLDATVFTANNEIGNVGKEVLLFPNPAANNLTLAFASNYIKIEVCIIDITGKIIYKTSAIDVRKIEVNTADLAAGVYVVQIQTGDFIETKKLVVEK